MIITRGRRDDYGKDKGFYRWHRGGYAAKGIGFLLQATSRNDSMPNMGLCKQAEIRYFNKETKETFFEIKRIVPINIF